MTDGRNWSHYEERLRRVTDYIHAHLDEELDMDRLAEVACLSPYHWHRIYRAVHGETLAMTVKRLRLQRAAGDLVHTTLPVRQIAWRWGYPNLQSFNRIFTASFGMPPARYRRLGSHRAFLPATPDGDSSMYDVTVKTITAMSVVGIDHRGSYMAIGAAFETLHSTLFARRLMKPDQTMLALYFDDPEAVAVEALRSFAAVTCDPDLVVELPLQVKTVAGGTYAVLRHKGPYANMGLAYQWLYGTWLRQSGQELRDLPAFEIYLNTPRDVPPTELLTEIYLPLQ